MKTLVLYESQHGNTKQIADTIGMQLLGEGPVRVIPIQDYSPHFLTGTDLVLVGGPTRAHGATPAMRQFLSRIQSEPARIRAIAFDTRIKGPVLLWGSASREIHEGLRDAGFDVIGPAASFLVTLARQPELHEGEQTRAADWACELASEVQGEQLLAS